jgi:hypothetical protein
MQPIPKNRLVQPLIVASSGFFDLNLVYRNGTKNNEAMMNNTVVIGSGPLVLRERREPLLAHCARLENPSPCPKPPAPWQAASNV